MPSEWAKETAESIEHIAAAMARSGVRDVSFAVGRIVSVHLAEGVSPWTASETERPPPNDDALPPHLRAEPIPADETPEQRAARERREHERILFHSTDEVGE